MVRKKYKSPLVCPFGCYMNEMATPSMCFHMNYKYIRFKWLHKLDIKVRKNNMLLLRWESRFRKYRRVLC